MKELLSGMQKIFSLSSLPSEGQEKYLRELSITPVGTYFTGAIKTSLPSGVPPQVTILHGEN
jgi:hypothetical protein